jgi:thymidylate synthase
MRDNTDHGRSAAEHEWNIDYGYLALLSKLANSPEATSRHDRTGVGTFSLFGEHLKHDLSRSFPLLTTKKVSFKAVAHELLWMMRGDTNVKSLNDVGVTIWDEWADKNGELGPIYSHQWRRAGGTIRAIPKPRPQLRAGLSPTYLGVANGAGKEGHPLAKTWEGMIARCYSEDSPSYKYYGARGVHVCDAWLEFAQFARDVETLPGWEDKTKNPGSYVLDKDILGSGFRYGPQECSWVSPAENMAATQVRRIVVEKGGKEYSFTNTVAFCAQHGVEAKNFSDLWTGNKSAQTRGGFRLVRVEDDSRGVDQLLEAQRLLREDPQSRRIIVSAWNVADLPKMALSPCHALFQFYSRRVPGDIVPYLDLHLYQRSADIFLGVPFNIASYALLTNMMAHTTGHTPGRLYISFGDVHLYTNHALAALTQLKREPTGGPYDSPAERSPQLEIIKSRKCVTEFEYDDFQIRDYHPHPHIPAPVAV